MPPKRAAKAAKDENVFEDMVFALSGTLSKSRKEVEELISENGGTTASTVTKKVTHLITTAEDFQGASSKVETAKKNGIHIVSEDFINDSVKAGKLQSVTKYSLNTSSKKRKAESEESESEEEAEEKPKRGKKAAAKRVKKEEVEKEDEEEEVEEKPKRAARGKKAAPKKAVEDASASEEEEKPKPRATRGKKAAVPKAVEDASDSSSSEDEPAKDEGTKKKIVVKGRAAVDEHSGHTGDCHVLENGDEIFNAMLNQTNIDSNNNKFYVIQVLEADKGGSYYTFNRWGRVGENGQKKLVPFGSSKDRAIADFRKKFKEKTKNDWDNRAHFKPAPQKYTLIEIDYGADASEDEKKVEKVKEKAKKIVNTKSDLDERVQNLVKLIFDLKMMETTMSEMEFDVKKSPLGKLSKKTIKEGYEVLQELDKAIKNGAKGDLSKLTSRFYTLIPHSFGRTAPPVIKDSETIKKKMAMLEALGDIEIATKIMKATEDSGENPIDSNFKSLKCDMEVVETDSDEYKHIQAYVKNTHQGKTPTIKCVYRMNRQGEKERFKKDLGNRKLLWHGSRLTNYVGIISQGLRIAPPEAPVSGYRFGKGIYFADIMSLSSIYCRTSGSADFCMLLGDVALGKEAEVERDTYMEKAPAGHHSTKALGTIEPAPKEYVEHEEGYVIPCGKVVDSGKKNVSCREHQYIVYDVSQVQLRYLLHLNW